MRRVQSPALRLFRTLCANPAALATSSSREAINGGVLDNGWWLARGARCFSTGKPDSYTEVVCCRKINQVLLGDKQPSFSALILFYNLMAHGVGSVNQGLGFKVLAVEECKSYARESEFRCRIFQADTSGSMPANCERKNCSMLCESGFRV